MNEPGAIEQNVGIIVAGGEIRHRVGVRDIEAFRLNARNIAEFAQKRLVDIGVAITRAPCAAKTSDVRRPMPCAAAVTMAVLPFNLPLMVRTPFDVTL